MASSASPQDLDIDQRPIVISGPPGAGKSSLMKRLTTTRSDKYSLNISHTTRQPREGELHGREYFFVSFGGFHSLAARGELLEYTFYNGDYYGTSRGALEGVLGMGKVPMLDVEMEGVAQIREMGFGNGSCSCS